MNQGGTAYTGDDGYLIEYRPLASHTWKKYGSAQPLGPLAPGAAKQVYWHSGFGQQPNNMVVRIVLLRRDGLVLVREVLAHQWAFQKVPYNQQGKRID